MSPKDADGMSNSVDPDQTVPLPIRKLRILTDNQKNKLTLTIPLAQISKFLVTQHVKRVLKQKLSDCH